MKHPVSAKIRAAIKKLFLAMLLLKFGTCAHPAFAASAQAHSADARSQVVAFEIASIKPTSPDSTGKDWDSEGNRVTIQGYTLRDLIKAAYKLKNNAEIVGGPEWLDKKRFDINAKIDDGDMARLKLPAASRDPSLSIEVMLQNLLYDRFNLRVQTVQKEMPILALVVDDKSKLIPNTKNAPHLSIRNEHLTAVATSIEELVVRLSFMREVGDRPVIDRTGLTERYDFTLNWSPDRGAGVSPDSQYPGLLTALREQTGLSLKAQKGSVPVIEVQAAEMPVYD